MRTPIHRTVSSLSLSLLLVLPSISATAGGHASDQEQFDLHLEEALIAQNVSLPFDLKNGIDEVEDSLTESEQPSEVSTLEQAQFHHSPVQWMASEETSRIAFETQVTRQVNSHGGRFGKWIKKYWYVPVIAGAVIGVAVSDDGSDTNDTED